MVRFHSVRVFADVLARKDVLRDCEIQVQHDDDADRSIHLLTMNNKEWQSSKTIS